MKIKNRYGREIDFKTDASVNNELERFGGSDAVKGADSRAYRAYLQESGLKKSDVIRALGFDNPGAMQARALLDNDGTKPLFNSIVEDGLRLGVDKGANWQQLVAKTINNDALSVQWQYLETDNDEFTLREVGQGAPIPVGTIKVGDQSIRLHKRGRGIEWTDEAKRANLDLVQLWLRRLGNQLSRDYQDAAVDRLLNGYFADGTDAAPTLGVATAGTLTLGDIFYAAKYQDQELGFTPKRAVMSLNTAYDITNMRDGDAYIYREELENGEFADVVNSPPIVSNRVPDNRIILVDSDMALVRHRAKEFGVESERSAKTQVEGSYGTEISEFVPFENDARLILTLDQAR